MKTYCFEEIAGHGEITEWVPADVARVLFDSVKATNQNMEKGLLRCTNKELNNEKELRKKAIKKACGEL